jgi:ABC-type dipeptide/oligopeptide/nickel transport system permease component
MLVVAFACFGLFRMWAIRSTTWWGRNLDRDRDALRERSGSTTRCWCSMRASSQRGAGEFGVSTAAAAGGGDHRRGLPATLELVLVSALLALSSAFPWGYTGLNRDGAMARIVMTVSLVG